MSLLADARSARNSKRPWRHRSRGSAECRLCRRARGAAPTPAGGASPPRRFSHRSLTPTSHITVGKSDSSRIARTDRSLLREHGRQLVPVVVKFDYDALAAYRGSIQGLPATSPSVTRSKLNTTTCAAQAYTRFVVRQGSHRARPDQGRGAGCADRHSSAHRLRRCGHAGAGRRHREADRHQRRGRRAARRRAEAAHRLQPPVHRSADDLDCAPRPVDRRSERDLR